MSELKIIRASAGSGKTFRLTEEYLKLIFKNIENYRTILAVTFTNKAAEEMKSRIIREINCIAKGEPSAYIQFLENETGLPPAKLQNTARLLLTKLLHDYSRFSVGTIDSFFQRIIRSFAREAGLQASFNLEMDMDKVLTEVVDKLLLDIETNESLRNWLTRFSENKIEESKSWNLVKDIRKLSYEIFKEDFMTFDRELIKKLEDKPFIDSYLTVLQEIKTGFENTLMNRGVQALRIIAEHSLVVDDFPYKDKGFASYFVKLAEKRDFQPSMRPLDAHNHPEKWYSKSSTNIDRIKAAYNAGLNNLLGEAIEFYSANSQKYNSAVKVLGFIYTLGIITDIAKKIREYATANNVFLISDSSKFLSNIIDGNDIPFIYEKTGYLYKHIMIDEFQDTSRMQWNNFKPLISNCLSENNTALLVGDVKQSIYRWRNSDWKLLGEQAAIDFSNMGVASETLKYNWRSERNIIDFNNTVFHFAPALLQEQFTQSLPEAYRMEAPGLLTKISDAYTGHCQLAPDSKTENRGFVRISFVKNNADESWKNTVLAGLPQLCETLQDNGYRLRDIAVLVRTKNDGKEVVKTFLEYKNSGMAKKEYRYDVVSDESMLIANASSVKLILAALNYFVCPGNAINKAELVNEYHNYIQKKSPLAHLDVTIFERVQNADNFKDMLPPELKNSADDLIKLSLFELTERIIYIFGLNTCAEEIPYLQTFQDAVHEVSAKATPDITTFLKWWKDEGYKKSVVTPDRQDAVRVMTIHKAKGLEFKAVIVPFCNWKLDGDSILWCQPGSEPFNRLELLPVAYSKALADSIFYKEYYHEKLQSYVDNLNLLYVAYTRAREALFAYAPAPEKTDVQLKDTGGLLLKILSGDLEIPVENSNAAAYISPSKYWNAENLTFEYGKFEPCTASDQASYNEMILDIYPYADHSATIKLKLHHSDYFSVDSESKTDRGKIMHGIFEQIGQTGDIAPAIRLAVNEGRITEADGAALLPEIEALLNEEPVKGWFDGSKKVKIESSILSGNGKSKRPDRVLLDGDKAIIIDYKFGRTVKENHKKQLQEYTGLLRQMGYASVEGYLWYVDMRKTERVV